MQYPDIYTTENKYESYFDIDTILASTGWGLLCMNKSNY